MIDTHEIRFNVFNTVLETVMCFHLKGLIQF